MVYSGGFAVGISSHGEFLEERKDGRVIIPINSEYSIRLHNKNNRRAVGQIFLDGENVSKQGYIIPSYSFIDIERYANLAQHFKFVSLNSEEAIQEGKSGPNIDGSKGLVECHFWLERQNSSFYNHKYWNTGHKIDDYKIIHSYNIVQNSSTSNNTVSCCRLNQMEGVTVKGGHSTQVFSSDYIDLDYSNEVILKLVLVGGEPRPQIIYCDGCGCKKPKKNAKFCYNCGNNLN